MRFVTKKIYSIDEIRNILNQVLSNFAVEKAILFGSYAKNKQTENSDIDLIIDSKGKLLNINFYGLLEELVEKFNKRIDLIEISEIKKESDIDKIIKKEGIVIYEREGIFWEK